MRDIRGYVASLPETHSSVDLFENAITRIRTLTSEKIDEMTAKTLTVSLVFHNGKRMLNIQELCWEVHINLDILSPTGSCAVIIKAVDGWFFE